MIRTLIKKEIIVHILSLRFATTFGLIMFLVLGGFFASTKDYLERRAQHDEMKKAALEVYGVWDYKGLAEKQQWNRLFFWNAAIDPSPVPPMSVISPGLAKAWPGLHRANAYWSASSAATSTSNSVAQLFYSPNFAHIVNVVLSFLALLFVFSGICGEKENGTLRLTLSNSVPKYNVLAAKWVAAAILLLVPMLVAYGFGIAYAHLQGALEFNAGNVKRLITIAVAAMLYVSVFFTLGLLVSSLTVRASTSLFVCLCVWVIWIAVIPGFAPVVSGVLSPVPAESKIRVEAGAVQSELRVLNKRLETAGTDEDNPARKKLLRLVKDAEYRLEQWENYMSAARDRQSSFARTLGRISPSASWIYLMARLTDTGPEAYSRLISGRKRFQPNLANLKSELGKRAVKTGEYPEFSPDKVPAVQYRPEQANTAIAAALNDILLLAIMNIVLFMGAFLAFMRYDVR